MLTKLVKTDDSKVVWTKQFKDPSFSYSTIALPMASAATDIFQISANTANPNTAIIINELTISGAANAAASLHLYIVKRKKANTGGTAYTVSNSNFAAGVGVNDINNGASVAKVTAYSANPTINDVGTLVYTKANHFFPANGAGILVEEFELPFPAENVDPLVLRCYTDAAGVVQAEALTINMNGQTVANMQLYLNVTWTESTVR